MSSEQAQNQEQVIEAEDSAEFQLSRKPLRTRERALMEEEGSGGEEQLNLIRSNGFVGPYPAKQPYMGYNRYMFNAYAEDEDPEEPEDMDEDGADEGDFQDLAWFFRTFQPKVDKHSQIAWCRTFANSLAAMMPKNRPKTYKKAKTEKENKK